MPTAIIANSVIVNANDFWIYLTNYQSIFPILVFTQKASPAAIIATPVIKINNESILYLFKILLPTYAKPTVAIRHPANNHIVFSVIAASFIQLHASYMRQALF